MNKSILLISIIMISMATSVFAESPSYSLGTMQPAKNYISSPGKELTVSFYVFNAYGNRISHINLGVSDNPSNLIINLPQPKVNSWNISGIMTPISEVVYVQPMPMVDEQPAVKPEGVYYIQSTNVSGFIPSKKVDFTVSIPSDAQYGSTYNFTLMATADWYGETATSAVSQSRPFQYMVTVVSENYSESLYVPSETKDETKDDSSSMTGFSIGGLSAELIVIVILAGIIVALAFIQLRSKKSRY